MKKTIIYLSLITIIVSCTKDNITIYNDGLIGKWELTNYYEGLGIAGGWRSADDNTRHTIEFRKNRDFISPASLYYNADAYELPASDSIKFLHATQINGDLKYHYKLEEDNSILTISPQCFEGCSYKYKAIK